LAVTSKRLPDQTEGLSAAGALAGALRLERGGRKLAQRAKVLLGRELAGPANAPKALHVRRRRRDPAEIELRAFR